MYVDDRSLQRALAALHLYSGPIDGLYASRRAPAYSSGWADDRVRLAVEQAMFKDLGFYSSTIDGLDGPATHVAAERWQDHITFNRPSPDPTAGVAAATVWPLQRDCPTFYGAPGTNQTHITPPYPVFYGDQPVRLIVINKRCAESALRILQSVLAHYGLAKIHELGLDRFSGCYNNRPMRNGRTLSMHAFACAWDWDAGRNQLRMNHTQAQFAKPEYAAWFDAHEAEGWVSLGRARDFDWMHCQAARLA